MMTFWVLEDLRCKWSPTPQYLHAEAGFYSHNGNWYGKIGGGGYLHTPDIDAARKFPTRAEAEAFRVSHGHDCGINTRLWASREHAWIEAPTTPAPVSPAIGGHVELRDLLAAAYEQGCIDTHNSIQAEPELALMPVEHAEFGEAAGDYAISVLSALEGKAP